MPLEFSVLIGLGAVVVCALKGHYWWALGIVVALSIAVVGVVSVAEGLEEDAVSGLLVLGVPLVIAAGAVWLSLQGPLPGSYWARLKTTDAAGTRLITKEPGLRRFGRSLIGALVGTLPAIAFMALAILSADTISDTATSRTGIATSQLTDAPYRHIWAESGLLAGVYRSAADVKKSQMTSFVS